MSISQYATVAASGAEGQASINIWLKDMSAWVPGAHRSVMKRQLILAMREFYEQTWAWRAALGPYNIVGGQNTVMLSPFNAYADVVGVDGVFWNGVPLYPLAQRPADDGSQIPSPPQSAQSYGYYLLRPDILALYPTPLNSVASALIMQVALRPKMSVQQVPHIAVTDHYEAILDGALYRLLQQPAKPYSNLQLAAYFENKFRFYVAQFRAKGKTGNNPGAATWRFPYFGNGKGQWR